MSDRFAAARAVADAVLFEGYVLYPYRASSSKNQLRWQFGVLVPGACRAADPSERSSLRTECVVEPGEAPRLLVRVSCLQVQRRTLEKAVENAGTRAVDHEGTDFLECDGLEVEGNHQVPWDEAVRHDVDLPAIPLFPVAGARVRAPIVLAAGEDVDLVRAEDGSVTGRVVRRREEVRASVQVTASWVDGPELLLRVTVAVENTTDWFEPGATRADVVRRSLVAAHVILGVDEGAFVSSLDPADHQRDAVDGCVNDGVFPVLVGVAGATDLVLASPIILYDYPVIAPESEGDLYDATEIDEILALRVLTLTDEEKDEARATDPRAAAIIERCDNMAPESWERLHGTVRSLESLGLAPTSSGPDLSRATWESLDVPTEGAPWWDPGVDGAVDPDTDTVRAGDTQIGKGSRVRLRPSRRADAHDLFLAGLGATVAGVFHDVDGNDHVAVTLDDDPASAELAWQGRYLYFAADELEPLTDAEAPR